MTYGRLLPVEYIENESPGYNEALKTLQGENKMMLDLLGRKTYEGLLEEGYLRYLAGYLRYLVFLVVALPLLIFYWAPIIDTLYAIGNAVGAIVDLIYSISEALQGTGWILGVPMRILNWPGRFFRQFGIFGKPQAYQVPDRNSWRIYAVPIAIGMMVAGAGTMFAGTMFALTRKDSPPARGVRHRYATGGRFRGQRGGNRFSRKFWLHVAS